MSHNEEECLTRKIDQAFSKDNVYGLVREPTYAGATSFLRRRFTKKIAGMDIAIAGIPYDLATSNRSGAREGPRYIRIASEQLANFSPYPWGFDPTKYLAVIDYGDFDLDHRYPEKIPNQIYAQAQSILRQRVSLIAIGGDHFITLPLLRAHASVFGPLALVHFDAHSDSREDTPGRISHGTMFYHAVKENLIIPEHSVQIGIRTHNEDKLGLTWLEAPWIHEHGTQNATTEIKKIVGERKAYLTFDIDCLDPAYAPGTGTPVIGGLTTWQARALIQGLRGIDFVGMDLVEVSPPFDQSGITALAGATFILDYLCLMSVSFCE